MVSGKDISMDDRLSNIYFINMDHKKERDLGMRGQFYDLNIIGSRFKAFWGKKIQEYPKTKPHFKWYEFHPLNMLNLEIASKLKTSKLLNELGCYQSHLEVWIRERDYQIQNEIDLPFLIFEDDAAVEYDFINVRLDDALKYLEDKEWDFFYLGHHEMGCD